MACLIPFFIICDVKVDIERADIDVKLCLTCINADINVLKCICIHNKLTLACEMRARDPEDYSSVMLGVLSDVRSCYRSLNRGASVQSNYQIENFSCS